jgi:hypothetical protein
MDYTQSNSFVVDAGTGFNRHEDNAAVPTAVTEKDMNQLIWSLMDVVKAGGHVGIQFDETNPATYKLLTKALRAAFGGNVTTLNLANSPLVLTKDNAGLVLVDATAGNVSATLPAANVLAAPVKLRFVRIDATTNTATMTCAGADTFIGGATAFTLLGQGGQRVIECDAVSKWVTIAGQAQGTAQCYLDKSALNLVLSRSGGHLMPVNGSLQEIPAAGVVIAPTALAAASLFYIYVYMNGGVMTGEASATVPVIDATTGLPIKTGDPTRALVGAWKTAGAGVWSTIPTEGASWFNRREKSYTTALTATRSTTSGTPAEVHAEIRGTFFMWDGEMPLVFISGVTSNTAGGVNAFSQISWNGGTAELNGTRANTPSNTRVSFAIATRNRAAGILAQGLHYATLFVSSDPGAQSNWEFGSITGTSLTVTIKG